MTTCSEKEKRKEHEKQNAEHNVEDFSALYTLKTQIAKGGYGAVWTANPNSDVEHEYAVKVIDRSKLKEKDVQNVFREVEIMKELREMPHVISIVDFFVEPRNLYVVQLYAGGGDLLYRLTQRKQYTEKCARDIALVLFQTLDDMHSKYHIIHRDLKPENLLLEDLITEKVYLADFGFARHVTEEGLKTRCGTPAFVAPEIVLGRRYKQPVDMWSIGVIMFIMLGGYNPFAEDANDLRLLFRKVRAGDFTFHQSQWKNVSPEAKCLIARLLTVDPEYRYTAKQALQSDWIQKIDAKALKSNNLSDSLTALKTFNGRLSLKGAMNAVRFAISANFWNPETTTFSRDTTKLKMNDLVVNAALHSPTKSKFHDEYEQLRKLREGSCATVHLCRHKGTGEIFAVKIVRRAKLRPSEDEFVLNEASIMQSLSRYDKYVVQILDFYEEEEFFYLVRDYMSGGNVFDRLSTKTKYTEKNAKELTKSLLEAVKCMHEAGIAHRDLKPQNLLLRLEDDDSHIRVADFGFARRVHTPNCLTSRCGSPTFVAPEILKNIPHDQRADLWSVGVIIYLLLVGYPPFVKTTQSELFTQIRSCDWKFHKEDWENISPDARKLIENLLLADPEQRWTASESSECSWLQDGIVEDSEVDLTASIKSLRDRRARLRHFSSPVQWQKHESTPIDASLQNNDSLSEIVDAD